jgi:hypothetical protein
MIPAVDRTDDSIEEKNSCHRYQAVKLWMDPKKKRKIENRRYQP